MKKKALFVGVNDYKDDEIRNLHYALDDARSLHDIFEELGYKTAFLKNPGQGEILSQVRKMTEGLSVGDQFVFYFSGHGFTDDGQHLLFCVDDVYANLRYKRAGMPFELLEEETRKCGCDRVFMLDACRSDFLTGTRGADTTTKDLCPISHMVPKAADATGAFYVLRSCSRYEHAFEIDKKQHGLFTLAMMEVIRESKNTGSQLLFNDMLRETVEERMSQIARNVGLSVVQTPESEVCGRAQILINGRNGFSGVSSHSVASLVTCPICGKRNRIEDTFKCRQCGSDNLCLRHQDEKTFLCFNCVEKGMQKIAKDRMNVMQDSVKGVQLWEGGPYWADRNIGAENPWDSGYYFWWGDTVGYKRVNDKWVASDGSVSNFLFDESNVSTYGKIKLDLQREGWINNSGILISQKDAAQVCWGGEWRIPTYDELDDLYYKCVWVWTELNGACGYIIHGQGNYASASIFLPAAGCGCRNSLNFVNSDGLYWSSKVYVPLTLENLLHGNQYCNMAWTLNLTANEIDTCFASYCYCGQSIRPVRRS